MTAGFFQKIRWFDFVCLQSPKGAVSTECQSVHCKEPDEVSNLFVLIKLLLYGAEEWKCLVIPLVFNNVLWKTDPAIKWLETNEREWTSSIEENFLPQSFTDPVIANTGRKFAVGAYEITKWTPPWKISLNRNVIITENLHSDMNINDTPR